MRKLYKLGDDRSLRYHEAWVRDEEIVEHFGAVGSEGSVRTHSLNQTLNEAKNLTNVLADAKAQGYSPIPLRQHATLIVEYPDDALSPDEGDETRGEILEHLDQLLGWMGLGHCDGSSIGATTMDFGCCVVDYDCAKTVIEKSLADIGHSDNARIYREDA